MLALQGYHALVKHLKYNTQHSFGGGQNTACLLLIQQVYLKH